MLGRCLPTGAVLALVVALTSQAGAQSNPACPAGVVTPVSFAVQDVEAGSDTTFTATHTLQVDVTFNTGGPAVDESTIQISAPPGVPVFNGGGPAGKRLDLGSGRAAVQPSAPGPLTITATWTQDDGSSTGSNCTGSGSTTVQVGAPTPLRLSDPRHRRGIHVHLKYDIDWKWGTNIGKTTDLRPVEVRLRGVSRARLPSGKVPFKTATIALRQSDASYGLSERHLRSPHWFVGAEGDDSAIGLRGQVRGLGLRDKPLGYELQVLQGGRLIARLAAAGKCDDVQCNFKTLKLKR